MANLDTAVDRARKVTGPKAAAKMYNDINHELELGAGGSEERYEQGEQALSELEERFPGIAGDAASITDPPGLSRGAGKRLHRGDHRPALGTVTRRQHQREKQQPNRSSRQRLASATAIHARPRSNRSWSARRFAQTGIPAAADSGAQLLMRTIGGIAGLSFFYLLLTPNGSRAVQFGSNGAVHALQAIVSPVDPLRATAANIRAVNAPPIARQIGLTQALNAPLAAEIGQILSGASKRNTVSRLAAGH
jgi:hypothetical protein